MKFLVVFVMFGCALGAKLPEGSIQCHRSDPKFSDCLKDAITDGFTKFAGGYKPLGIMKLEPVHIPELSAAGSGGLSQTYKNIDISGLTKSKVTKMKVDIDALTMECEVFTAHSEMTADYNIKGQLMSFPIDSSGKCKIEFDDTTSTHKVKFEKFEKDGKKYIRVADYKLKIIPSKVHYNFEDIMPGNKQLSETILQTINENAVQIYLDQAATFEEAYAQIHKAISNKVYEKIPVDELFLP